MTKVKEMAKDVFSTAIKEQLSELRNKALTAGVTNEKIEDVIGSIYNDAQNFQLPMATRRVKTALENTIRAVSAKPFTGIVAGSKDFVGKNRPARFTLLVPDGKHIELSNYGTATDYQGQKFEIPVPAFVAVRAVENPEYGGWELISIERYKTLSKEELAKNLAKTLIPISKITSDFTFKKSEEEGIPSRQPRVVVVAGQISRVSAEPVWSETEDSQGNKSRTIHHYLPVYMPREIKKDEYLPCFGFNLSSKTRGINALRCHLRQMRHGTPTIMISDLEDACADTINKIKDPEAQAESLGGWYKDMPVIVVGTVDTFKPSSSADKGDINWIDISVSCVVDIEGMQVDGTGIQQQITPPGPKQTAMPPITTQTPPSTTAPVKATKKKPAPAAPAAAPAPAPAAAPVAPPAAPPEDPGLSFDVAGAADQILPSPRPAVQSAQAPAAQPAAPAPAVVAPAKIAELAKMVKIWCKAAQLKPTDISVVLLKERALDMVENVPDSVVEAAIAEATRQMQETK